MTGVLCLIVVLGFGSQVDGLPPPAGLAVMPVRLTDAAPGATSAEAEILAVLLTRAAGRFHAQAVRGPVEWPAAAREAALQCEDTMCAARVGAALGAEDVIMPRLTRDGPQQVLSLYRVRVADARVLASSVGTVSGVRADGLMDGVEPLVAQLFPEAGNRWGGVVASPMAGGTASLEVATVAEDALDFEMGTGWNATPGQDWGAHAMPVEGPRRRRMGWEAFYERVGRPDLAERLDLRTRVRTALNTLNAIGSGVGLLAVCVASLAGLFLLLLPAIARTNPPPLVPPQWVVAGGPVWWFGLVLLGLSATVGFVWFMAGSSLPSPASFIQAQPLGETEIRALAERYNRGEQHVLDAEQ